MKKLISCFFVMALLCFSFYYTDLAATIIKNNDPIMKEINKVEYEYKKEYVNATIDDLNLIPGINGVSIDKDKSYYKMKQYGSFNEDLMVFEEITPTVSITNTYDKFISKGNSNKMMVSLVFLVNDYSYLTEIINILDSKNVKATFFISNYLIDESTDIVRLINDSYHQIEIYNNNYSDLNFDNYNRKLKYITKEDLKFCLSLNYDSATLNKCSKEKCHTINPNIITTNYPYNEVKNSVEQASIIELTNNQIVLRELPYIINYIKQKGYSMVTLTKLLEE